MKCEKCNAEFTLKDQARTKGICPSCGVMLSASAYCNDSKAWLWYLYHSPMPLSVILAYIYLVIGGMLALVILSESADCALWAVIASLPFLVLFFMPSARQWRAKCRADALVYKAAVKSGKLSLRKYRIVMTIIGLVVTLGLFGCLLVANKM